MATVVQSMIEPDRDAIKAHLEQLFAPARSEYPSGLVELRHGPPGNLTNHQYFFVSEAGIEMASKFAADWNSRGENVYVGVNPRKKDTTTFGTAADVEIAFFHFADIDKGEAVESLVERYGALPPTMTITTGSVPNKRPHLYWRLEEPVRNLSEWTERQRGIAQALGGDMVIDPPRIMRLAGTVNFPTQKKLAAGYRVELTSIRTQFANERSDVTPDMVRQAYPPRIEAQPEYQSSDFSGQLAGQTTLSAMSRGTRVADLIDACRSGDNWHNHMVRLVAHLAAIGRTSAEIIGLAAGITLPGYTPDQTAREMITALKGARTKWALPEPADDVSAEESDREDGDSIFQLLDLDELEAMPPPSWLIDGLITEHGLSIVYGDPGAGKSFVVLDVALRLVYGLDWHGSDTKQVGVLYIAGEGSGGLGKRVKGWRREHALEGVEAPFRLLPVAVQMLEPKNRAKLLRTIDHAVSRGGFAISLVIIDTVSRAIAGQDENGQEAMSLFVSGCGEIQAHTRGAVIGVHHSGKDKERGMRGSTVLLGGCDASLKVTKSDDQRVKIEVEKQKDAEEAEPIYLNLKKVEWAIGLGKEESTLVPLKAEAPAIASSGFGLSTHQSRRTFDEIEARWFKKKPFSTSNQTRGQGRYLAAWVSEEFGVTESKAVSFIGSWLSRELLEEVTFDSSTKARGLRVVTRPEDWR